MTRIKREVNATKTDTNIEMQIATLKMRKVGSRSASVTPSDNLAHMAWAGGVNNKKSALSVNLCRDGKEKDLVFLSDGRQGPSFKHRPSTDIAAVQERIAAWRSRQALTPAHCTSDEFLDTYNTKACKTVGLIVAPDPRK